MTDKPADCIQLDGSDLEKSLLELFEELPGFDPPVIDMTKPIRAGFEKWGMSDNYEEQVRFLRRCEK